MNTIGFAGFGIAVESSSSRLAALIRECYAGFASAAADFLLRASLVNSKPTGRSYSARGASVEIVRAGRHMLLISESFDALVDVEQREIRTNQPCAIYPIDVCLKVAYAATYPEHRGFLLHACGVARDGIGYVFFGPTGSGKSTIVNLLGATRLADELVAIRAIDGRYFASGTPFWGGTDITVPIGGLFNLKQADSTSVVALSRAEAARRLLREAQMPGAEAATLTGVFQDCCGLAEAAPCSELAFNLDAESIWTAIEPSVR